MQYTGQIVVQLYMHYHVPILDIHIYYWNESSKLWGTCWEKLQQILLLMQCTYTALYRDMQYLHILNIINLVHAVLIYTRCTRCVCVCVCVCVCLCVYVCARISMCMCVRMCTCVCVHVCMSVQVCACIGLHAWPWSEGYVFLDQLID